MSLEIYLGTTEDKPHKVLQLDEQVTSSPSGFLSVQRIYRICVDALESDESDLVSLANSTMSIHAAQGDIWINCGVTPVNPNIRLPLYDFVDGVKVKFDSTDIRNRKEFYEESENDEYSEEDEFKRKKRKVKKIKEIIETVFLWKKLTEGVASKKNHEIVKFKPKEASEIMGLPIKTLYDYMYSLK